MYERHQKLFDVKKLKNKKVLIVGCGALGSRVAELLIRAAPLSLTLMDFDTVSEENLSSQMFHKKQVGKLKTEALKENLKDFGKINILNERFYSNVVKKFDVVVDCTDNMITKFTIAEECEEHKKPLVFGSVLQSYGMQVNFIPGKSKFEKIFSKMPLCDKKCSDLGVLNTIVSVVASLQATEALKILLKEKVDTDLITFDIWKRKFRKLKI